MAVDLHVWSKGQFTKRKNSTKRPKDTGRIINCYLKDSCGILNPVIVFQPEDNTAPVDWNYAYIGTFDRYYLYFNQYVADKEQFQKITDNYVDLRIDYKALIFFTEKMRKLDLEIENHNSKYVNEEVEKNKEYDWEYQNELNRIIDFGLFDKQTTTPLLLIEINDRTHHESKRIYRDQKVKDICEQAGIKLIAFWSEYSNTEKYIVERISKELNSD